MEKKVFPYYIQFVFLATSTRPISAMSNISSSQRFEQEQVREKQEFNQHT